MGHEVQGACTRSGVPATREDVEKAVLDFTVAGDGGPVRKNAFCLHINRFHTRAAGGANAPDPGTFPTRRRERHPHGTWR